jgi:hypothetical protein
MAPASRLPAEGDLLVKSRRNGPSNSPACGSAMLVLDSASVLRQTLSTVAIIRYNSVMARQTTLNVSLTPTLQKYIHAKVREQAADVYWAEVRSKVQVARKQVAEGKTHDGEQAMNEIIAEVDTEDIASPKRGRRG